MPVDAIPVEDVPETEGPTTPSTSIPSRVNAIPVDSGVGQASKQAKPARPSRVDAVPVDSPELAPTIPTPSGTRQDTLTTPEGSPAYQARTRAILGQNRQIPPQIAGRPETLPPNLAQAYEEGGIAGALFYPTKVSSLIPKLPEATSPGQKVAKAFATFPIQALDFLSTPEGVATIAAQGSGALIKNAVNLGFTIDQIKAFIKAGTLEDKVKAGIGTVFAGSGIVSDIKTATKLSRQKSEGLKPETPPPTPEVSSADADKAKVSQVVKDPPKIQMDTGESPLEKQPVPKGNVLQSVSGALRKIGDFFSISPIPNLTRSGLSDSAYAHAAARNSVVHTVKDLLARVFPEEYKNPVLMKNTGDILVKDNILGIYDQARSRLAEAEPGTEEYKAADKAVRDIEEAHDLDAYDKDVREAQKNPRVSLNISRWKQFVNPEMDKMYGELMAVDPNTEFDPRGRHFGARINLLPLDRAEEIAAFTDGSQPMPSISYSNYRNPNVRRDPFARRATGTGQYSTDPGLILTNTMGRRWNEVTKLRMYNDIVQKGHGIINDGEKPAVEGLTRLPIKIPETTANGATRQVEKSLWVKKDLARETRDVLNTDLAGPSNPIFRWLTGVQLLQATDLTAHLKNIHTVIANSLGSSRGWVDAVRKMPVLASFDAVGRILKTTHEVLADSPQIRGEVADMARQGLIRPQYPLTGIQKITRGQQIIHAMDTASRITMNRFWNNLVERDMVKDTATGRRKFVQQIGEYNRRLMGPMMRFLRDSGASPFVVAGRSFNKYSRRLLVGSPGFKASSTPAAIAARVQMLSGLATATLLPAIINYFTTGNFGGRPGTPIGAIDTGTNNDKGQMRLIDIFQLMGIRRGLRGSGVQAVIEGVREDQDLNKIGGKAIEDITTTASHPWIGPGLGALYSTISGKRLDLRGGSWPYIAKRIDEGGLEQYRENARVTLKNQNPLIYSLLAPLIGETDDTYLQGIQQGFLKAPLSGVGVSYKPEGSAFEPKYQ